MKIWKCNFLSLVKFLLYFSVYSSKLLNTCNFLRMIQVIIIPKLIVNVSSFLFFFIPVVPLAAIAVVYVFKVDTLIEGTHKITPIPNGQAKRFAKGIILSMIFHCHREVTCLSVKYVPPAGMERKNSCTAAHAITP